jgi:hypothetical protein
VTAHLSELFLQATKDACAGWPLIFFTCRAGQLDIFQYLLNNGTDPNATCAPGLPILAFVVLRSVHVDTRKMVKMLLQAGADPRAIPVEAIDARGGARWAALRQKMRERPQELPEWWMSAPEVWMKTLQARLYQPIRSARFKWVRCPLIPDWSCIMPFKRIGSTYPRPRCRPSHKTR